MIRSVFGGFLPGCVDVVCTSKLFIKLCLAIGVLYLYQGLCKRFMVAKLILYREVDKYEKIDIDEE